MTMTAGELSDLLTETDRARMAGSSSSIMLPPAPPSGLAGNWVFLPTAPSGGPSAVGSPTTHALGVDHAPAAPSAQDAAMPPEAARMIIVDAASSHVPALLHAAYGNPHAGSPDARLFQQYLRGGMVNEGGRITYY